MFQFQHTLMMQSGYGALIHKRQDPMYSEVTCTDGNLALYRDTSAPSCSATGTAQFSVVNRVKGPCPEGLLWRPRPGLGHPTRPQRGRVNGHSPFTARTAGSGSGGCLRHAPLTEAGSPPHLVAAASRPGWPAWRHRPIETARTLLPQLTATGLRGLLLGLAAASGSGSDGGRGGTGRPRLGLPSCAADTAGAPLCHVAASRGRRWLSRGLL